MQIAIANLDMRKILFILFSVLFLGGSSSQAAEPRDVQKDMQKLDQIYDWLTDYRVYITLKQARDQIVPVVLNLRSQEMSYLLMRIQPFVYNDGIRERWNQDVEALLQNHNQDSVIMNKPKLLKWLFGKVGSFQHLEPFKKVGVADEWGYQKIDEEFVKQVTEARRPPSLLEKGVDIRPFISLYIHIFQSRQKNYDFANSPVSTYDEFDRLFTEFFFETRKRNS
jgi:hypothetical protein